LVGSLVNYVLYSPDPLSHVCTILRVWEQGCLICGHSMVLGYNGLYNYEIF